MYVSVCCIYVYRSTDCKRFNITWITDAKVKLKCGALFSDFPPRDSSWKEKLSMRIFLYKVISSNRCVIVYIHAEFTMEECTRKKIQKRIKQMKNDRSRIEIQIEKLNQIPFWKRPATKRKSRTRVVQTSRAHHKMPNAARAQFPLTRSALYWPPFVAFRPYATPTPAVGTPSKPWATPSSGLQPPLGRHLRRSCARVRRPCRG